MKLYSSPTSPYARKARVIVHELGLDLDVIDIAARGNVEYRRVNPLGKIPALVLDDGSVLIDSPVICEYLNDLGGGKFFPGTSAFRHNSGRWKALGLQALGDGLADAAVAWIVLGRENPPPENTRARQMAAIGATLDVLERSKFSDPPTIGEIAVACAISYVEFRIPDLDWKPSRPQLAAWYDRFCEFPSMKATVPAQP